MKFQLGDKLKDVVTGFRGVVIGRTEWLNGCVRYGLQSSELYDCKPIDSVWVDEEQLKVVKKQYVKGPEKIHGGPKKNPVRRSDPK